MECQKSTLSLAANAALKQYQQSSGDLALVMCSRSLSDVAIENANASHRHLIPPVLKPVYAVSSLATVKGNRHRHTLRHIQRAETTRLTGVPHSGAHWDTVNRIHRGNI